MQTAEMPRAVRANVRKLDELPPLPQNTERLLAVLGSDDIDLEDLARTIEEVRGRPELESDSACLCDLLHNLGLLVLVHVAPEEMAKALQIAAEQPDRSLTLVEPGKLLSGSP